MPWSQTESESGNHSSRQQAVRAIIHLKQEPAVLEPPFLSCKHLDETQARTVSFITAQLALTYTDTEESQNTQYATQMANERIF